MGGSEKGQNYANVIHGWSSTMYLGNQIVIFITFISWNYGLSDDKLVKFEKLKLT